MTLYESIKSNLVEDETGVHTVDNDPAWAAAVEKVNAKYKELEPEIKEELMKELKGFVRSVRGYFSSDEILNLPEVKAYKAAILNPEDIWCECSGETSSEFKPDGESYLGVSKHGYICNKCKKFTQIG